MAAVRPTPSLADAAIGDPEQLYRLLAETIPLMVWTADASGEVDFVNRRVQDYTGLDARRLAGWGWKEVVHPEDWERCLATWTRALQAGERSENEMRLRRADGKYRWHHGSGVPVRDREGRLVRWFGICADIEDHRRSAQLLEAMVEERTRALRDSEQRFQLFMDVLPAQAWIRDAQFRYTYVNPIYAGSHGLEPQQMIGQDASRFFSPEVAERFRETDRQVLGSGAPIQIIDALPAGRWLKVKFPFSSPGGEPGVAGIALDISARMQAEETARHYAEDVRRLLDRLVGAQEAERRHLADNLHDLIGQNLTALGIELGALKTRLAPELRDLVAPRLDAMSGLLNDTIESIRGVMTELRPPALEEYGLVPAVRWYAAVFSERTGMKVSTNVSANSRRLPRDTELALFRILQEALTNAVKHSGGTCVEIAMTEHAGGIRLSVEDDGRGFADPVGARSERRGGWGLPTMRERAEAHGGNLRIEFPGRGTRLVVEIPQPP